MFTGKPDIPDSVLNDVRFPCVITMAYWNKEIECMPPERIKELQLDMLQKLMK